VPYQITVWNDGLASCGTYGVVPFVALFGGELSGEGEPSTPINATGGSGELVTCVAGSCAGTRVLSSPAFWDASGVPASREQRGHTRETGKTVTTLLVRRRPPSELERPVIGDVPAECPVWQWAGGDAEPEDWWGTLSNPARPAGASCLWVPSKGRAAPNRCLERGPDGFRDV